MDSIMSNGTWEITPSGCKLVRCKWIFKKKPKFDGAIEKYNGRLVDKGFTLKLRRRGLNYHHKSVPFSCSLSLFIYQSNG
jgi:hypothetical protein